MYWELGAHGAVIPNHWDKQLEADINEKTPISVTDTKNNSYLAYISVSN